MRVLKVIGCRSSVVRTLVAKTRVPGIDSLAATKIFFHIFPLLLSRPLYLRKFQSSFYERSELDKTLVIEVKYVHWLMLDRHGYSSLKQEITSYNNSCTKLCNNNCFIVFFKMLQSH